MDMRIAIKIIEGAHQINEQFVEFYDGNALKKIVVHTNPSANKLHTFFKNKGPLRGLLANKNNALIWWVAAEALHDEVREGLNLTNCEHLYVYPESEHNMQYFTRNHQRDETDAVLLYDQDRQRLVIENRYIQEYKESGLFDFQTY